MRFIKITGIYRNFSHSRPSLSQSNAAELWKLATKTKQSNTLKAMESVVDANLEPIFTKIYSNIEDIIVNQDNPHDDIYWWRKNENVTPQIIHWIYDVDISLAEQM